MKVEISTDSKWARITVGNLTFIMPMTEWAFAISHPGQFSPPVTTAVPYPSQIVGLGFLRD
jgi:hypothetical protein